jgi:nicotinamidase-related amidase
MSEVLSIDPRTAALLVMDFQVVLLENFISKDEAAVVLNHTAKLLAAARSSNMMVIYVTVAFRPGYPEISPNNKLFTWLKESGHFTPGSEGTKIHPSVAPKNDEAVVVKHRVSAFSGTDLDMLLRANGIRTLVLAGITTAGVTLSTVRQGFDLDYHLVVAGDCCADHHTDVHHTLLEKVFPPHATIATADEIDKALQSLHFHPEAL